MTDATKAQSPAYPIVRVSDLVEAADAAIGHMAATEAHGRIHEEGLCFVDVRDVRELARTGRIPGARHCPRGMLEFWIDPASPYHKPFFGEDALFVFYCASGWRSALAAQTARQMGLPRVTHIKGGITAWLEHGFPVEPGPKG